MELLITLPLTEDLLAQVRGVSPKIRLTHIPTRKAEDVPAEIWAKTEVLFTGTAVPSADQAFKLKWIQFSYAGIDRWVREPIFSKPDISITTLSGASAPQVAEYVVMMMLALGHRLPALTSAQRKTEWTPDRWERFMPFELRDSTTGIVGYGSIGRHVARLLRPFGTTVLATKQNAMDPADNGYTAEGLGDPGGDFVHRLYPAEAVKSMLKLSDYIVVCVPLTPKTRGLINTHVLSTVKPGAFIVDVSRGNVIEHAALVKALQDGRLAGAALDVFPEEPLPANSPLWTMPNVIVTPHIADSSPYFLQRATALFTENLHRYMAGMSLYNLFDPQRGY